MRGAVVVTDVKTGGVLALYSNPERPQFIRARYQQQELLCATEFARPPAN